MSFVVQNKCWDSFGCFHHTFIPSRAFPGLHPDSKAPKSRTKTESSLQSLILVPKCLCNTILIYLRITMSRNRILNTVVIICFVHTIVCITHIILNKIKLSYTPLIAFLEASSNELGNSKE